MLCSQQLQRPCLRPNGVRSARSARISVVRSATKVESVTEKKEVNKEDKEDRSDLPYPKMDNKDVMTFMKTMVEDTDFVDLSLQVGSFELNIRRSVSGDVAAEAAAPAPVAAPVEAPAPAPITPPSAAAASMDESLVQVFTDKVGIFRRGKVVAGRVSNTNAVEEGDQLKVGATVGFVEQLGTYFPVTCPHAGEIAKFKVQDGEPVGYGQLVMEVAPFFGGQSTVPV